MTDCSVCCEKINKKRFLTCCISCSFTCCCLCIEKNANLSTETEIKCMSCSYIYSDDDFIQMNMRTFVARNEKRIGNIIIEKSAYLRPQLIEKSIKYKEGRDINLQMIKDKKEFRILNQEARQLKYKIHQDGWKRDKLYSYDIISKNYKNKCPNVSCSGYITEKDRCETCNISVCSKCYKPCLTNHICNEDDVASIKYLLENSVSCPDCKTRISRVDGCEDMYCINCSCKFKYTTGNRIFHKIHNPHIPAVSAESLNDCRPVDIPPYEIWKLLYNHPYYPVLSHLISTHHDLTSTINEINSFTNPDNIRRRINTLISTNIANEKSQNSLKKELGEDYKKCKSYRNILEYYLTLKTSLIDIVWYFAENKIENDLPALERPNKMREAFNQAYKIIFWFSEQITQKFYGDKYIRKLSVVKLASLVERLNRIPSIYFEYE